MELTLDQALQKGIEAHQAGRVEEADQYYTGILKTNPKHPDANHNMGLLAVGMGKFEAALPFFKIALEANSSVAQFWLSYINALIKLNRIADAKAAFAQASTKGVKGDGFDQIEKRLGSGTSQNSNAQDLSQSQIKNLVNLYNQGQLPELITQASQMLLEFPNSSTLFNVLGVANNGLGKFKDAVNAYKKALSINPEYAEVYNNLGITLKGQGKLDDALEVYKKALSINPDYAEAYNNIGNALQDQRKLDEAIDAYNKALSVRPDYIEAYNNLGIAYKDQGKLDEVIEAYKKALSINPDSAEAYNNIGNALQDQRKLDEAIDAYNKALSVRPDYIEAYNNLGIAYKDQGKLDEAIEAYKKGLFINPDSAKIHNNIGNAFKGQGKLEEAIGAYNKAISTKPDHSEAYYNLGNALQKQSKLEEAVEAYKKVLSLKPDFAEAYNNMGSALKRQGKLEQAIEAYKNALFINPDSAEAYNNMGNALNEQGKLEEAIDAYDKVLSIKPDHDSAKHMLAALTGNKNETAPREYIENLFDGYSKEFEASLIDKLEYKTPKLLKDILTKSNPRYPLGSVLDLGCGTGLLGAEIRNHCSKLEGVDLSNNMLKIAKKKNIYDNLSHLDIVEHLSISPLDFDYYIAADVFVYVGELSEIFRLIKSRNKKPGKLVFSTEHTETDGYHLLKTGRYSHSKSYIESLCKKFDYNVSHFSTAVLRKDKKDFLTGGIYVLGFT